VKQWPDKYKWEFPETQTNFRGIYYYGHVLAVPAAVKVGAVKVIWEKE